MEVHVRPATSDDWPAMRKIFIASGRAAWGHILKAEDLGDLNPPDRWRQAIHDPDQRVLVAVIEWPAAFIVLRPSGDDDATEETGEVDSFYSHPQVWGAGAGRALLERALAELEKMGFRWATLWTAELNHRPRRIYEAAGWKLDGASRTRTRHDATFVELRYRKALSSSVD